MLSRKILDEYLELILIFAIFAHEKKKQGETSHVYEA